jgi:DNA invertase Pin-like site-specific DNA recombinase
MPDGRFVSYLRVSTAKQGASGLGLEAQRRAVADFLNGGSHHLVAEVVEIESGKRDDRPKLAEALAMCQLHNAVLMIAKLDRLSRDVHFLTGLEKAGVRFVAADMPEANELTIHVMAVVARAERKMISTKTKAALAAKREWYAGLSEEQRAELHAEGKATRLGGKAENIRPHARKGHIAGLAVRQDRAKRRAADLAPIIADLRAKGVTTLRGIAAELNAREIPTAQGGKWSAVQVQRVLGVI